MKRNWIDKVNKVMGMVLLVLAVVGLGLLIISGFTDKVTIANNTHFLLVCLGALGIGTYLTEKAKASIKIG